MRNKETMKEAGYRYRGFAREFGAHVLEPIDQPGKLELWFANKGHASYGIRWRNTDLEFASTIKCSDTEAANRFTTN